MPNTPAVFEQFCERLGVEDRYRKTLFWAGLLGLPAAWWAFGTRSAPKASPDTHINAFFKQKPAAKLPAAATAKRQATSFHSFLKQAPLAHRDPSSFGAFLKAPGQAVTAQQAQGETSAASEARPKGTYHAITVLFGTEFGFSKEVAERTAAAIKASGAYWAQTLDMAEHPEGIDLSKEQVLVVVCSTQGDGVPPSEARDFCDWLASDAAPALPSTRFAVCALGDRSYANFCNCGKQLDRRLEALQGQRFAERLDVHREDLPAIDKWLATLTSALGSMQLKTVGESGGASSSTAGSKDSSVKKRWGKTRPFYGRVEAVEGLCQLSSAADKDTIRVEIDLGDSGLQYTPGDALGVYPLNCPQAVEAVLEALGQEGSQKVPRPGWHYQEQEQQPSEGAMQPGQMPLHEALTKCYDLRSPRPELLQLLFDHLPPVNGKQHANGNSHERFNRISPSKDGGYGSAHQTPASNHSQSNGNGVQQNALHENGADQDGIDQNGHHLSNGDSSTGSQEHAIPSREQGNSNSGLSNGDSTGSSHRQPFVQVNGNSNGVKKSEAQQQARHLQDILQQEAEAYLERRHIIDILHDFSGAHPPLASLLACLRPLLPRLYSISSSQLEHPLRVQITVAVVKYTALGHDRIGVTSTFLKERMQVGDCLPVYVAKNPDFRLPQDLGTPIIMVGPGTGLAPFRAFMQERIQQQGGSQQEVGQCVLFFGCRRSDQDYLYGSQLEQWAQQGLLTLHTAFSRQQEKKVYVQDRIRESGALIWQLLEQGAHFYVCGDAAHMAGSVEKALLQIIEKECGSQQAADEYLANLQQQHRYERDVWF